MNNIPKQRSFVQLIPVGTKITLVDRQEPEMKHKTNKMADLYWPYGLTINYILLQLPINK